METLKFLVENKDLIFMILFVILLYIIIKSVKHLYNAFREETREREQYILEQHKETQKKNEEREKIYLEFINKNLNNISNKLNKLEKDSIANTEDIKEIKEDLKEIKEILRK